MLTGLQVRAADASWLKRRVFEYFRALAERRELLKTDGKPIPAATRLGYRLGEFFVYGPVRDQLGLRNAQHVSPVGLRSAPTPSASSAPSASTSSRSTAPPRPAGSFLSRQRQCRPQYRRPHRSRTQVRIGERGEVEVKGPGVFVGYYKQDDATRDAVADGWLKTGDAGLVDPRGQLAIIDRAKDVGKLADGTPLRRSSSRTS